MHFDLFSILIMVTLAFVDYDHFIRWTGISQTLASGLIRWTVLNGFFVFVLYQKLVWVLSIRHVTSVLRTNSQTVFRIT